KCLHLHTQMPSSTSGQIKQRHYREIIPSMPISTMTRAAMLRGMPAICAGKSSCDSAKNSRTKSNNFRIHTNSRRPDRKIQGRESLVSVRVLRVIFSSPSDDPSARSQIVFSEGKGMLRDL